jgi:PTH1 family peptidyl-tRNA hydrolase
MVRLVLAQGNPGTKYTLTRHNVGFLILDHYASQHGVAFQSKSKFNADIAEFTHEGEKVLLVKPMTFYNETGVSARALVDFYKIDPSDILVIHDELMLPFGKIRVRHSGRDAGNNGIKSLNNHIGDSFARIRIGIQSELRARMQDTDFVLATFTGAEQKVLEESLYGEITTLINKYLNGNLSDESISIEMKEAADG